MKFGQKIITKRKNHSSQKIKQGILVESQCLNLPLKNNNNYIELETPSSFKNTKRIESNIRSYNFERPLIIFYLEVFSHKGSVIGIS